MKYFLISDIHNCYDEMRAALSEKGFLPSSPDHIIIFLGDAFEKGAKPCETYVFLKDMLEQGRLIWVRGNHDMELVHAVENRVLNKTNRPTATALAQTFNSAVSGDEAICNALLQGGFTQWIMENSRNYFELDEYVFVHGYIPLCKGKYDENWRAYPTEKWGGARKTGAVKAILKEGVRIPEKTVVCGHVGAYYGHVKEKNPTVEFDSPAFKKLAAKITAKKPRAYYETFYGDGVIAIDANAYATGFMNCITIEK